MQASQAGRRLGLIAAPVALFCCTAGALAADIPANLGIDRVTVYRTGAVVTRAGQVEIPAGTNRLVVRGLPASIEAKSLRVSVASAAVTLGGVEMARINEGKFTSEAERELRRRIEETNDQRQVVQDEVATAQMQLKLLESLAANPAGSPTKASVDGSNLGAVLTTMSASAATARRRVRESTQQMRTIDRTIEKLKADLANVSTASRQSTEVRTSVEASAATLAIVSISYLVADAGWEWIYEARLDTKAKRITLERQGQVLQGTGEDWKDVEVTLTTAQPSGDVATPEVGSIFLTLEEPPSPRDAIMAKSSLGMAAARAAAPQVLQEAQEVVVTGGRRNATESATDFLVDYRVPGRTTLLADRGPRLYPIAEDAFDVTMLARIVPSARHEAHLEAAFKYNRDVPIESGSLQLYRDGAFVGEAANKAFLPGAEVRMPFGVDERIRVAVHDEKSESAQRGVISRQTLRETRQRFDITNFHPAAVVVEVIDRVPVSKHSDVRIEMLKGATEPTTRDFEGKAGVLLWKFNAEPQQAVSIRHYFSVQYPRDRQLESSNENDD